MSDVTRILSQMEEGDPRAAEELLPLVYEELRKLAAAKLAMEKPGQTLVATALVHEAYVRLVGGAAKSEVGGQKSEEESSKFKVQGSKSEDRGLEKEDGGRQWNSRGHFFAAAAEAMRRIVVEQARRKKRVRHGGGRQRVELDSQLQLSNEADDSLVALDEALERLSKEDPETAAVVKLRYFAGMTFEETALALGISARTANRHWTYARAWLYEQLQ